MNIKQPYELLITQKLEGIPIPDMSDMIWSRIEAQLDSDMPTNDHDGGSPAPAGPSPLGKIILGFGITAVVVALFSIFLNPDNETENNIFIDPASSPAIISAPQGPAPAELSPEPRQRNLAVPAQPDSNRSADQFIDSIVTTPAVQLPGIVVDSLTRNPLQASVPPPIQQPVLKDSTKKPRGVQGINDDDYKIEPKKKDS